MSMMLEIRTPYGPFYEGPCDRFTVNTASGVITVLPRHIPIVTPINIGRITLVIEGQRREAAISGGFLYVTPSKTMIVASAVEFQENIDIERAKAALERAKQILASQQDQQEMMQAELALQRALTRIDVASRH